MAPGCRRCRCAALRASSYSYWAASQTPPTYRARAVCMLLKYSPAAEKVTSHCYQAWVQSCPATRVRLCSNARGRVDGGRGQRSGTGLALVCCAPDPSARPLILRSANVRPCSRLCCRLHVGPTSRGSGGQLGAKTEAWPRASPRALCDGRCGGGHGVRMPRSAGALCVRAWRPWDPGARSACPR